MAAGLAFTVLYALHARKTAHPIVELQLLKSPRLRMSVAVYHAIPGVFTGVNLLNIFYLQDMLHLSAQATGRFMMVYAGGRSEEHTSEPQSPCNLVCRLLLE